VKRGVKQELWTSETPTHELAREMVALDTLILAAVKHRDFLQAHDLEHTRLLIMEKRSELLRRQWEARRLESLEA
jgi:hypothetical protein